ncbi:unnamed protein product [Heterobilharzia americana]|nr:unnamed protein product [Heterobilharzia americana]
MELDLNVWNIKNFLELKNGFKCQTEFVCLHTNITYWIMLYHQGVHQVDKSNMGPDHLSFTVTSNLHYGRANQGGRYKEMNLFRPLLIKTNITGLTNNLCSKMRLLSIPPLVPPKILYERQIIPGKTPEHHNNPEVERLLKEDLCDYPPYCSRKIHHGFQNAIMIRDHKRRQVAAHFCDLRIRLNAIRKNTVLPKEIQDLATLYMASLPRDSNWTRISSRCIVTSRRRGCKTRWRLSRIVWRLLADYNRMSGVLWAFWGSNTRSVRRHMLWPPPEGIQVAEYIHRYYENLSDERHTVN